MPICPRTETCAFFTSEVGYSPELNDAMKRRFCLRDSSACARLAALDILGEGRVPAEMLPTDDDTLAQIAHSRV